MRTTLICALSSLLFFSCNGDKRKDQLSFMVSPTYMHDKPMLKVDLNFTTESENGETKLLFLNDSWGEKDLHNIIEQISPVDERLEISLNKDSGWVVVKHPEDAKNIQLTYTIKQDFEEELASHKMYRPIIQEDYFHVFSHSLFMLPLDYIRSNNQKFDVSISWQNFPKSYNIVNTFGNNQLQQIIEDTSEKEFMESVFLGGDYRSYSIPIQDNEVVFSIRGEWEAFNDTALLDILGKTITAQRNFWDDHSQPYFSVNLSPTDEKMGSSFQGTGLNNAFNCSASNNKNLELDGLVYLFNHELQHNWIGHVIQNNNEEQQYWFSEGFTDYYTSKNIAKYQINGLDQSYFIDELNNTIKLLYTSPVKEAPNSAINYDNFWNSRDYEKLPYRRGALFAFYLDQKIKKESNRQLSLDDLMLAIKEDALKGQKLDHEYFIEKTNSLLESEISDFFNTHIEEGKLINLEEAFTEFGFEFDNKADVFDQGFTADETSNSIAQIDETSNAYRAGLRQGDKLGGWSFYYGQPDVMAEVTVVKNGERNTISYYPSKESNVPQLKNNEHNRLKLSL